MKTIAQLPCLLAALVLAGCATGPTITYDYVPGTEFSAYHTFANHPRSMLSGPVSAGPGVTARVREAVTAELVGRGFIETTPAQADVLLFVHGRLDQHVNVVDFGYELPIGPWRHGGYWGPGWYTRLHGSEAIVTNVGRLAVDVIDGRTRQLVWRGVARREGLPDRPDPARLAVVVREVLAGFPPPRPAARPPEVHNE